MNRRMLNILRRVLSISLYTFFGSLLGAALVYIYMLTSRMDLAPWHETALDEEFTIEKASWVKSFDDYLLLEDRLFNQLQQEIYSPQKKPAHKLSRYESGSLADSTHYVKNWNRSFILVPDEIRGGVLLLHGLSDSPYSLRSIALQLQKQGYYVLGLRMPGHGTIPSGLTRASWQDMAAAVRLAALHINSQLGSQQPFHVFGYSMGAAQAVNLALDGLQDKALRKIDSMVLLSPAIGVSAVAALASWQSRLAILPGMEKLAWNSIGPEYDPYKYSSFAVNAGDLMYRLTLEIDKKLSTLKDQGITAKFPPTLIFLSLADATVSTHAVVNRFLDHLDNAGNELVLFDLNRSKDLAPFLKNDPKEDYVVLLKRSQRSFNLEFLTNASPESGNLVIHRLSDAGNTRQIIDTELVWPEDAYSLSHVALPFPPDDPVYGDYPTDSPVPHIGLLQPRGEKGVLHVSPGELLRLRYNPFYSYLQKRSMDFIAAVEETRRTNPEAAK